MPKLIDHVDSFLLLRKVCRTRSCHQVVGISAHVKITALTCHIHPQSLQELTCTKTLHERIEFRHSGRENRFLDLLRLIVHKRASWMNDTISPRFAYKDCLTSLRALIFIVSICCVRIAYYSALSSKGPKIQNNNLGSDLPN